MPVLIKKIQDEMSKFPRDLKEYPRLGVKKIESKAWIGTRSLMFKGVVFGETDKYPVLVQFFGLDFEKVKSKKADVPAKVDGTVWYHSTPSLKAHEVSLKCGCTDFRFRWEFPLYKNGALIGNFRRYTPVPGSNRGPANPKELMGMCKHLYSMVLALKDADLIKA